MIQYDCGKFWKTKKNSMKNFWILEKMLKTSENGNGIEKFRGKFGKKLKTLENGGELKKTRGKTHWKILKYWMEISSKVGKTMYMKNIAVYQS